MDDIELDDNGEDEVLEDTSYRACYIFHSGYKHNAGQNERPNKKRKLNGTTPKSRNRVRIFEEHDSDELARRRQDSFEDFWSQRQPLVQQNALDEKELTRLTSYLDHVQGNENGRVATALLLTGLDEVNHDTILQHVRNEFEHGRVVINVEARQCPNLQTALKNIIKASMTAAAGQEDCMSLLIKSKRLQPLNFDLELLERFVRERSISQILVSLPNVEIFDGSLLNDLILSLHLWRRRIPFVLMLGITSTIELFQTRLSKSCLRLLGVRAFDFAPDPNNTCEILRRVQHCDGIKARVYLSPSIVSNLADIFKAQGSSARSLEHVLQYMYMSHFLANPVSALVDVDIFDAGDQYVRHLPETIRRTESFRAYCDEILARKDKGSNRLLRTLLDDDRALLAKVKKEVLEGQAAYAATVQRIQAITDLHQILAKDNSTMQRSKIEVEAQLYQDMHDLSNSIIYDELEGCIKTSTRTTLLRVLRDLVQSGNTTFSDVQDKLATLESGHEAVAATAKKQAKKAGEGTNMQDTLLVELMQGLRAGSLDISRLLLSEAYILSARTTRFKQSFDPHPRAALERALLRPGDYLGCECCTEAIGPMPPASILFTLLQEAPTIINVRDLFDAFQSRFEPAVVANGIHDGDEEGDQLKATQTQFYRALAELKMLGLIKASTGTQIKKRSAGKGSKSGAQDIDFVAKTSWASL